MKALSKMLIVTTLVLCSACAGPDWYPPEVFNAGTEWCATYGGLNQVSAYYLVGKDMKVNAACKDGTHIQQIISYQ
jgi:hypothetical protein